MRRCVSQSGTAAHTVAQSCAASGSRNAAAKAAKGLENATFWARERLDLLALVSGLQLRRNALSSTNWCGGFTLKRANAGCMKRKTELFIRLDEWYPSHALQGWPKPKNREIEISKGQEVIVTTDPEAVAHDNVLPIEQSDFDKVCKKGDTLFVGRYLTNGADVSSIYLDVSLSCL